MKSSNLFQFQGKLKRIDTFTSKAGKPIITLVFFVDGEWPSWIAIKVFGRLTEFATEWKTGDVLEVTGKLGGREYQGKIYGENIARTVEVVAKGEAQDKQESGPPPEEDPDVPF